MLEVRRPTDDELCGFVDEGDGVWHALTLFGGHLGSHDSADDAQQQILEVGLASLADRWLLVDSVSGDEEVVCICEVSPASVTVALGYYSLPGVPMRTIARDDLDRGRWRLQRR